MYRTGVLQTQRGAGEGKALAAKPDALSLIPEIHMVQGENEFLQVVLHTARGAKARAHVHTQTQTRQKSSKMKMKSPEEARPWTRHFRFVFTEQGPSLCTRMPSPPPLQRVESAAAPQRTRRESPSNLSPFFHCSGLLDSEASSLTSFLAG